MEYACGVQAWNGTSESLKPSPQSRTVTASTNTVRRSGSPHAAETVSAAKAASPVAVSHKALPSTSRANDVTEVTRRLSAP